MPQIRKIRAIRAIRGKNDLMLIDDFLPEYDFVETHSVAINADAASVYAAANEVDFSDSLIVKWLFQKI